MVVSRIGVGDYERAVQAARERFIAASGPAAIRSASLTATELEAFLIQFCSLGVSMTSQVEDWIRRAGLRCAELGYDELAEGLAEHALEEAGHDRLIRADTALLVQRWNAQRRLQLSAGELIARPAPGPVHDYAVLHESAIASEHPYGQLAIEYEIERLAHALGKPLLLHVEKSLGAQYARGLSFLNLHVEIDGGHTDFNAEQIDRLLGSHPEALAGLAEAGCAVLDIYAAFLTHCCAEARELAARSCDSGQCRWSLHEPCDPALGVPEWLVQCRALRSRVLYDGGRRPQFGPGGSEALDLDPLDFSSYHLIVTVPRTKQPIGTLRMTLLAPGVQGMVERLLGSEQFEAMLGSVGAHREQVAEFSRWLVDAAWRGGPLAVDLIWAGFAHARRLGARWGLGRAGRSSAGILVRSCGMFVVPGLSDICDPAYDDDVSIVAIDLEQAPHMSAQEVASRFRAVWGD
jgi:hypothetical protein